MRKAMGQKPTSTKETLKYVRKNGSGYIPPAKSDTVKPKAQKGTIVGEEYKRSTPFQDYLKNNKGAIPSDTVGKSVAGKPNMGYYSSANPKNEKALSKAIDKTYSKKKMGGATKPKAQLGAIVKAIGKGISTGAKVANKGIKAAKAEKFAKETAHLKRYEDWEKYNAAKPGKLVNKVVASAAGAGTAYVAGKAVMKKKK